MNFELEISNDNVNFFKVDLFPEQQLEYDLDFYDSLDISKVKLPFYTTLRIPLTSVNQASNRFNFDPFNSATIDFPKQDFYFKITIFGSSNTQIAGILNAKSFEYNSSRSFINVELKDYLSKYIAEIKDKNLSVIYDDNYFTARQTMSSFLTNEAGIINQNPDYTRPIAFPYIDFCNDVDGKFGYAARQFLEYGPGMTRAGIAPSFSVQGFFEYLADYISTTNFPLRVDSRIFEIGAFDGITGLTDFEPEKLQFLPPARLLAKQDTNRRNFFIRQSPAWAGTNQSLESCEDINGNAKLIHCNYFSSIETCGNYGTDSEGLPLYSVDDWGSSKRMDFYPYDNTSGDDLDGIRGFFAPKVSFNAALSFNSGNPSATLEGLKFEIPLVGEDKMVIGINEDVPESTIRWKAYIGVYKDGETVKKIALQDINGDDILLDQSNIGGLSQGFSNKSNHGTSATYDFFICPVQGNGNHEGAILESVYENTYRDTIDFEPVQVYFPTGEEMMVDSGSQYSINYFLEPFDGELSLNIVTAYLKHGSHYDSSAYALLITGVSDFKKAITRIDSYGQLDINFSSNADVLPYRTTDEVIIQDSINQTCPLTLSEVLTAILKRFECGLFYEYDSVNSTHVLRIDPLSLARTGGQDINDFLDDLKSVKISNAGDKVKSLEINNENYQGYFDDLNNDGVTIGSTLQEINTEGIAEIKIDLKSSVYYKSVCGAENDSEGFNSNFGAFSSNELGLTANVFTMNKDVGLRFAFLDKPLYRTNMLTPHVYLNGFRTDNKMVTESQVIFSNSLITTLSNTINGQHIFNGRLFSYNTAGWNLLFENEDGVVQDAYTDIFAVSEKILQSDNPRIEFSLVIPTSNLANLNFFLQTLSATNFTPNGILVKSASGDVYDDYAYLDIEGILQ
jgi:hypothetical protein